MTDKTKANTEGQTDAANLKAAGVSGAEGSQAPAGELGQKHASEVTHASLQDKGDAAVTRAVDTKPAILEQPETKVVAEKSLEEKAADVARKEAELNAHNEEGNAKNVERDEELAVQGHQNSHYDRAEQEGGPVEGKRVEENRNTPIIDPKTGAKSWV